jgi:hypothetical protein
LGDFGHFKGGKASGRFVIKTTALGLFTFISAIDQESHAIRGDYVAVSLGFATEKTAVLMIASAIFITDECTESFATAFQGVLFGLCHPA